MAIQIFTKDTSSGEISTNIQQLLTDAGFGNLTISSYSSYTEFTSDSDVYGCKSFSIHSPSSPFPAKYTAIKDDSRKALILLPEFTKNTITDMAACDIIALVIVNGVTTSFSNDELSKWTNAVGGDIKASTNSSNAILSPLIDTDGHIFAPFYISLNRVNHPINTVVTDGTNSFTSLGNLFYIKNA